MVVHFYSPPPPPPVVHILALFLGINLRANQANFWPHGEYTQIHAYHFDENSSILLQTHGWLYSYIIDSEIIDAAILHVYHAAHLTLYVKFK